MVEKTFLICTSYILFSMYVHFVINSKFDQIFYFIRPENVVRNQG